MLRLEHEREGNVLKVQIDHNEQTDQQIYNNYRFVEHDEEPNKEDEALNMR